MWNRLAAMRTQLPPATESDWQDLFAYLYSLQFEDLPGSAARGARTFTQKGCAKCHGAQAPADLKAVAVKEWDSVYDQVDLIYQMWSHAAAMYGKASKEKVYRGLPKLSTRDLMDLTAYAQSEQKHSPNSDLSLGPAAEGRRAYETHCASLCHLNGMALEKRLKNATFMDIAAQMWNHQLDMAYGQAISRDEMRRLIAYVWELQYSGPPGAGNSVIGGGLFRTKGCVNCHKDTSGAPRSPRPGPFTPFSMVAMSWGHGRQMHAEMISRGLVWPKLSPEEMSNLSEFLNTLRY